MTIFDMIEMLKSHFDTFFSAYKGLAFKCGHTADDGSHTNIPYVYTHLVPNDEMVTTEDGVRFPTKAPCILIHIISRADDVYNVAVETVVKYESVTTSEVVEPVGHNLYEYKEDDGRFKPCSELALYKAAVQFQDVVYKVLLKSGLQLKDVQFTLPDGTLETWPYAAGQITFNVHVEDLAAVSSPDYMLY